MKSYSTKIHSATLWLILPLIMVGCTVARQSQFSSRSVTVGMDKKEIMAKFGPPYKTSLYKDNSRVSHEDWYYKENLFIKKWYEVTTILHIKDDRLISMEPGQETPLYKGYRYNP